MGYFRDYNAELVPFRPLFQILSIRQIASCLQQLLYIPDMLKLAEDGKGLPADGGGD